jgi:hypothetical protein
MWEKEMETKRVILARRHTRIGEQVADDVCPGPHHWRRDRCVDRSGERGARIKSEQADGGLVRVICRVPMSFDA